MLLLNEIAPQTSGIYCIFNLKNGRRYIGSAACIRRRIREHKSDLLKGRHGNAFLRNDFNLCGIEAYVVTVLETSSVETLLIREQFWLDRFYDDKTCCYNINTQAHSRRGTKSSPETRQKIAKALAGSANPWYGKVHSPETRERIAKALRGRKASMEARSKMSQAQKARYHGK